MVKLLVALWVGSGLLAPSVLSAETPGLELSAFVTVGASGEGRLVLHITNRGEDEQTVLTENPTMTSFGGWATTGSSRVTIPSVLLSFRIVTVGTRDEPQRRKYIPSLPKLGPVTLRKGETATTGLKLNAELMEVMNGPDRVIPIRYSIGEELAKRFGLWHGTLELEATVDSLMQR